jgi:hypothetical protein
MVAKPAALARIRSLLNNGSTVAIFTPLRSRIPLAHLGALDFPRMPALAANPSD